MTVQKMSELLHLSTNKKALNGAVITTVVYGIGQALRLLSNLAMTRLLAPEHFGLMAVVNVFLIGLNMFSDIGIGPNIIQSEKGHDQRFLNVVWTMQSTRGAAIGLICVVAGWPLSHFYNANELVLIIPVCGLASVISGLNSTKIFSAYKKLEFRTTALMEIGTQVLTIAAMLLFAMCSPTVWALVFGAIFSALIKMLASHYLLPGETNQFCWNKKIMAESARFGKWIFLSTVLSFAANSAGSLILAKFVSMQQVGLFTIAATLAKSVELLYDQIANKVLFPLHAQIKNNNEGDVLPRIRRIKKTIDLCLLPMLGIGVVFSSEILGILLDSRYKNADWIFQAFCFGIVPIVIAGVGPYYLAQGNSKLTMLLSATRLLTYLVAMGAGWFLGQERGLIYGMALFTYAYYVVELCAQRSYKIWQPKIDAIAFSAFLLCVAGALLLKQNIGHIL